ncbi:MULTISPECIES: YnhF family membrane protein [unclassified Gilliamella]|nr:MULTISPECIES: YnhF family membrane protein [unclassified Gilliamella]MCX8576368.1 YnhF family membrane protein [Gilliamella sp. B3815]MCX8603469.1 YnhF family membrane protein [Gilliamella sp. B3823]MCX8606914.1 YnhF family membrane protein [Gilliamella sp. B3825]MCX8636432.1 YnhF family membrane protein [Gilliamella sp. B3817]MCX8574137.1 YnhF family membrane protein [Gilliamella sp. B3831]
MCSNLKYALFSTVAILGLIAAFGVIVCMN